jgi:LPPG:FO 2-phospho-L-lactate transferase
MSGPRIVALSGGVGGARLLDGLQQAVDERGGTLCAIVNTGDDFTHWGLHISPDLDTVMYTLSGLAHPERGWGLATESFAALEMVRRYGGEDWFALGDRDLATHLLRTQALGRGETLTAITDRLCRAVGVRARVLPMADAPCRTMIDLVPGSAPPPQTRSFQDWFVRLRAQPAVQRVWFDGDPPATPQVLAALAQADLVVIGPSNPYVSIDPILTRPGVRAALSGRRVVALSPIVGGQAIKGPLATMIPQLAGVDASAAAVASHYRGLLSAIVVERGDEAALAGLPHLATATVMRDRDDRVRLSRELLGFAESLS